MTGVMARGKKNLWSLISCSCFDFDFLLYWICLLWFAAL